MKYEAGCNDGKKKIIHIGYFNDSISAFMAYKEYKEQIINKVADEYKLLIPEYLYKAMLNYKIEIED